MNPIVLLLSFTVAIANRDRPITKQEHPNFEKSLTALNQGIPTHHHARNTWQERPNFGKYFQQAGVKGSFILYDLNKDRYLIYNTKRANTRFIPASTFKIFNSLVALETGAVRDENEVIKWDGVKREFPDWNQDQTMRTAIKYSSVWFYQELARRIGQEQMQRYVTLANYGNQNISGGIDLFVGMWATWSVVIMPISLLLILTSLNQMTQRQGSTSRRVF